MKSIIILIMIFFSDMGISTIKNENYLENAVAQPAKYQIPDAYKGNNPKARRSWRNYSF